MRFDQLEYFEALASCKTVQTVSEDFFTTAQVVSAAIKQLEKELGTVLFVRTKKGFQLTESGYQLYPFILDILTAYRALKTEVSALEPTNTEQINILSVKGYTFFFTNLIKNGLTVANTEYKFTIDIKQTSDIISSLQNANITYDLILNSIAEPNLDKLLLDPFVQENYEFHILFSETPKLFCHKDMLNSSKNIALTDISSLPLICCNTSETALDLFIEKTFNIKLNYQYYINDYQTAFELLYAKKGAFFATESYIYKVFSPMQLKNITFCDFKIPFKQTIVLLASKKWLNMGNNRNIFETLLKQVVSQ